MSKAKKTTAKKVSRKKVPTETRALAAAKVLVEGKSTRQAAKEAGTSQTTVRNAVAEVGADEDLAQYVAAYRAKALPKWLNVIEQGADATIKVMPKSSGRDIAALVKVFSDMSNRAAGEADVKHDHGDLAGARESLAARIAAVADGGAKGGGT